MAPNKPELSLMEEQIKPIFVHIVNLPIYSLYVFEQHTLSALQIKEGA